MDIVDIFAYTYCHVMILKLPGYYTSSYNSKYYMFVV